MSKKAVRSMKVNIIPKPSILEVNKYIKKWNDEQRYVLIERSLNKLFLKTYPNNIDIEDVLIKCSALNDFYSTNIFSIYDIAMRIVSLKIDERLKNGDITLINDIANLKIKGKDKYFYSFSTKYCSHHNQNSFAIYDSFVDDVLWYFKKTDNFYKFKRKDLRDYKNFLTVLTEFKKFYNIEPVTFKDLDKYLWQLGKEFFPKSY